MDDPAANIEEIFRCFICLGGLANAQMCPHCSKMCCHSCLKKWLTEQRPQCPHCRNPLRVDELVNCRFVADVSKELDKLQTRERTRAAEVCTVHNTEISYYCLTCSSAVCSDCAMFDAEHKDHKFKKLNAVYDEHIEVVRTEATGLRNRLKELSDLVRQVEANVEMVTKSKEDRALEVRTACDDILTRLDDQLKNKLVMLLGQKGMITNEIEMLDAMHSELNRQLCHSPKSILIQKSGELVQMLQELLAKPIQRFISDPVAADFESEVIPPFSSAEFRLNNYSSLKTSGEVIYSEPLVAFGITWRLKVYPNGNGSNHRDTYLSIFLEMIRGLQGQAKYNYRLEMVNARKPSQSVSREFTSVFEVGECWGYNRFFRIDCLVRDGYLIPEDDVIVLRFHVRAPTYHQHSRDVTSYARSLEEDVARLKMELGESKKRLGDGGQQNETAPRDPLREDAAVSRDETADSHADVRPPTTDRPAASSAGQIGSPSGTPSWVLAKAKNEQGEEQMSKTLRDFHLHSDSDDCSSPQQVGERNVYINLPQNYNAAARPSNASSVPFTQRPSIVSSGSGARSAVTEPGADSDSDVEGGAATALVYQDPRYPEGRMSQHRVSIHSQPEPDDDDDIELDGDELDHSGVADGSSDVSPGASGVSGLLWRGKASVGAGPEGIIHSDSESMSPLSNPRTIEHRTSQFPEKADSLSSHEEIWKAGSLRQSLEESLDGEGDDDVWGGDNPLANLGSEENPQDDYRRSFMSDDEEC